MCLTPSCSPLKPWLLSQKTGEEALRLFFDLGQVLISNLFACNFGVRSQPLCGPLAAQQAVKCRRWLAFATGQKLAIVDGFVNGKEGELLVKTSTNSLLSPSEVITALEWISYDPSKHIR